MISTTTIEELRERIAKVVLSDPFSDFDQLFNAMVYMANCFEGIDEYSRLHTLLSKLNDRELKKILALQELSNLVNLEPPLETMISWERHERSKAEEIKNSLRRLNNTDNDAYSVLIAALINVLTTIRNKRYHGFKTPRSPRDNEVLRNGAVILKNLMEMLLLKPY
jgi:hypothetical protein